MLFCEGNSGFGIKQALQIQNYGIFRSKSKMDDASHPSYVPYSLNLQEQFSLFRLRIDAQPDPAEKPISSIYLYRRLLHYLSQEKGLYFPGGVSPG